MLFLTLCLLFAEHQSARQMHGNIDLDFVVSKQSGRLSRQLAYLALGAIGAIAIHFALQRTRLRWNRWLAPPLALLLTWTTLSLLWTDTPGTTAKRLFVLGLMSLGAFGLALSWSSADILRFVAFSSAIQVTVGLGAELLYGYFTPFSGDYRFAGTLPWNSQGYVCLVLALSSMCLIRMKARGRWIYQVLAAYGCVFLLLTRSRGGLVAFSIAFLLYLILTLKLRGRIVAFITSGILLLLLVVSGAGPVLWSVLNRGGEGSENFTGRAPLWEELMTYVAHHPWTGYGYEGFWTVMTIDDVSGDQFWAIDNAHSGYIEGLLEVGWPGTALHTLVLIVGMSTGIALFRRTGDYIFFLGASLCFVYLVGGVLEALLIIKTSQSSFYFALLVSKMAVQPKGHARIAVPVKDRAALPARKAGVVCP